jgi:hypothetical protein
MPFLFLSSNRVARLTDGKCRKVRSLEFEPQSLRPSNNVPSRHQLSYLTETYALIFLGHNNNLLMSIAKLIILKLFKFFFPHKNLPKKAEPINSQ